MSGPALTREGLAAAIGLPVSRETKARLDIYVAELTRWQGRINLVGTATLQEVWLRHVADSGQLAGHADGETWLDLGSGAGLPGLIVAALRERAQVTLVESDQRKCAFLRHVAHAMGLDTKIISTRIEAALPTLASAPQVTTARALGSLSRLLAYAQPFLATGAIGLFPKGRAWADELTAARESWTFDADVIESRTDRDGRILRVRNLARLDTSVRLAERDGCS